MLGISFDPADRSLAIARCRLVEEPMDPNAQSFLVGVAASVIAAVIVGLFTVFALPRLKGLAQNRTLNVQGKWDVFDSLLPEGEPVGSWNIRQRGNRLWVDIRRHRNRQGGPMSRKFTAVGDLQSDQLTCVFRDQTGKHRTGAIVLRSRGSGAPATFTGRAVYWDRTPDPGEVLDDAGVVSKPYSIRQRQD
jgi:hypothetical protein